MSGDRGLRWPSHARAQLAVLLAVLVGALALIAVHSASLLPARGGAQPLGSSAAPAVRMTTGELPQAALGPVSAVLGAAEPSYHVRLGATGARAVNRAQGFAASFAADGVRVSAKSLALSIRTTSAGFGSSPAAVAAVTPQADSNRVTYDRPGVQEWYANGPFGLEQGFTLDRSAAASQRGATYTVTMALSATSRASLAPDGRSVVLRAPAGGTLRYGGLRALDAAGRLLPSWLSLHGHTLSLRVRTAGARFPVSIDPEFTLTGTGLPIELGEAEGEAPEKPAFGTAVALSGDGTTALVGAPDGESHSGAAWIFHREGARWSQQGPKLTAGAPGEEAFCEGEGGEGGEAASCAFGSSVALDKNGGTALIGAPRSGLKAGLAWVFNRLNGTWLREAAPLEGTKEEGQQDFGFSVALSNDGKHALIGAPTEHGGRGEAYVFENVESTWSSGVPLVSIGEGAGGHLGSSVALSADGQKVIAGAPLDKLKQGTAFIFEHVGNAWAQNGNPLTGEGETGEGRFGESVAMSAEGSTVLVGAPAEKGKTGAVWTFVLNGAKWEKFGPKLVNPFGGVEKEEFGRGLALSADGNHALVGAPRATTAKAGALSGSASLFEAEKFKWALQEPVLEAGLVETGHGQFGKSVSMTEDAETVLIGAPHETFKAGAVWLFGERPTVEEVKLPSEKGKAKGRLGGENKVIVVGKNIKEALAVWFGANRALKIEERDGPDEQGQERLVVIAPPGDEAGEVDVTVETEDWLSAVNTNDQYLYVLLQGEKEPSGGGGGGSGPKKHPRNENGIPIGQLFSPPAPSSPTPSKGGVANNKSTSSSCKVSLRSSKISVATHARAMISLAAHGTGRCGGHLSLQVSVKKGKHTVAKTIASGTYVATAGHNLVVALHLGSTGQALLRAGHGHLKARLLVGRTYPTALKASATNVTLSNAKKKG